MPRKKKNGGGDVVIFSCVLRWREERGVCDLAFRGRVSSRFLTGFSVPGARAAEGLDPRAEESGLMFWGFSLEAPEHTRRGKRGLFRIMHEYAKARARSARAGRAGRVDQMLLKAPESQFTTPVVRKIMSGIFANKSRAGTDVSEKQQPLSKNRARLLLTGTTRFFKSYCERGCGGGCQFPHTADGQTRQNGEGTFLCPLAWILV